MLGVYLVLVQFQQLEHETHFRGRSGSREMAGGETTQSFILFGQTTSLHLYDLVDVVVFATFTVTSHTTKCN